MIELLVVIAIIAILAGLLIPALASAKLKATNIRCMSNFKQLQFAWHMYAGDNNDYLPGNNWQMESGPHRGLPFTSENWLSGWLNPLMVGVTDNTNTDLFLSPAYSQLGPYTKSKGIYQCAASRVTVRMGNKIFPLARTVSMNSYVGYINVPQRPAFTSFRKLSGITKMSSSMLHVFIDERDDSIDDGEFLTDMQVDQIANFPAAYHGGSTGLSFADGHAEIHRWITKDFQPPQSSGTPTEKKQFTSVAAGNVDLKWLRDRTSIK